MRAFLAFVLLLSATPARSCDLALVLAVDVSGSVDAWEYRIQRDGLAAALRDPVISEALVRAEAQVSLVQWTGSSRQRVSIPWTRIVDFDDVEALAQRIESTDRVWRNFSTAIGEALVMTARLFDDAPDCARRVIDVSGDGSSNEGISPEAAKPLLTEFGITVNALVIEGAEEDLTGYFWENVIHGPGAFVETANGFAQYPQAIRRKLLREITRQVAAAP